MKFRWSLDIGAERHLILWDRNGKAPRQEETQGQESPKVKSVGAGCSPRMWGVAHPDSDWKQRFFQLALHQEPRTYSQGRKGPWGPRSFQPCLQAGIFLILQVRKPRQVQGWWGAWVWMHPEDYLTSQSRTPGSIWVITPSWLSRSLRPFW